QSIILARNNPRTNITAIDISSSSIKDLKDWLKKKESIMFHFNKETYLISLLSQHRLITFLAALLFQDASPKLCTLVQGFSCYTGILSCR
ncbi:hypothetical protein, partial [Candidatus Thiosymbion oneisti]|uniref:hypothetical protein n=1 Tax=Candidatus Thiosymbion oneisti TaxID=589554 RepID=UPI001FB78D8D